MKLNFKNLAVATAAVFALTACNNNEEITKETENARVELMVRVPNATAATRGLVTDAAGKTPTISIDNLVARVMSGNKVIGEKKISDKELLKQPTIKADFGELSVNGSEKVSVILNNPEGTTEVAIDKIQPTVEKPGIENAVYAGSAKLGVKSKDNIYTVSATAKSIVARLEISGKPQFNAKLVNDMKLVFVSPIDYSLIYGLGDIQKTVKGAQLALEDITGLGDSKVVANHLFDGDATKVIVGFEIDKKACLKDKDGKYITYKSSNFVFKTPDNKYYTKVGDQYFFTEVKVEGDKTFLTVAKEATKDFDENTIASEKKTEYFTLANFDSAATGIYEGGNVYKIDLNSGMNWNKEGDHKKEYTPDTNEGTSDPDKEAEKEISKVSVDVTVAPWGEKNTVVDVQ